VSAPRNDGGHTFVPRELAAGYRVLHGLAGRRIEIGTVARRCGRSEWSACPPGSSAACDFAGCRRVVADMLARRVRYRALRGGFAVVIVLDDGSQVFAGVVIFVEGGRVMTADHHSCNDLDRGDDQIARALASRMREVTAEVLEAVNGAPPAVLDVRGRPTRGPT